MSDESSLFDAGANSSKVDIAERIVELTARGVIRPSKASPLAYTWEPRLRKRAGGLQRFLKERKL